MTDQEKAKIDAMSYEALLRAWRFAPVGDPRFQGEHGQYWSRRMAEKRNVEEDHGVGASKRLGW